jgi:serine phosphatase RsbU (regulator of sigma subunit)/tetratricopeptide (TPR) repeat protein
MFKIVVKIFLIIFPFSLIFAQGKIDLKESELLQKEINDNLVYALKTNETADWEKCISLSKYFLKKYPEDENAYRINWMMTQILDEKLGAYQDAYIEYIKISIKYTNVKYQELAAFNAVSVAEKMTRVSYDSLINFENIADILGPLWKEFLNLKEIHKKAQFLKSEVLLKLGYENYLRLFPDSDKSATMLSGLGTLYFKYKNFSEAEGYYKILINRFPDSPEVKNITFPLLEAYFWQGNYKISETIAKKILSKQDIDSKISRIAKRRLAESIFKQAQNFSKNKQYSQAGYEYKRVVETVPDDSTFLDISLYNSAREFEKAGIYEIAIKVYAELITKAPNSKYTLSAILNLINKSDQLPDSNKIFDYAKNELEKTIARYGFSRLFSKIVDFPVSSIARDKHNRLWLGTKKGLMIHDGKNLKKTKVEDFVNTIYIDKKENAWIGTINGLIRCNTENLEILKYYDEKDGLPSKHVTTICEDKKFSIWIGTSFGTAKYDIEKDRFAKFKSEDLTNRFVNFIFPDAFGDIWFSVFGEGAVKFSSSDKTITIYDFSGRSENILTIFQDKKGDMWLGTDVSGIEKYNWQDFLNYDTDDGLPSNEIRCIIEDDFGNIWFGTPSGLSKYNPNKTKDRLFDNFLLSTNKEDNNIFTAIKDHTGNLWFGTEGGLFKYPKIGTEPLVKILRVGDKILSDGETEVKDSFENNEIEITYSGFSFKTGFDDINFAYQLVNNEEQRNNSDWINISESRSVKLEGLKDGEYSFYVKAIEKHSTGYSFPAKVVFRINSLLKYPDVLIITKIKDAVSSSNLSISFIGTDSKTLQENLLYSYRLLPIITHWSRYTKENSVEFNDLQNGKYTFEVRVIDEQGNIDPTPASLNFEVKVKEEPEVFITLSPAKEININTTKFEFTAVDNKTESDKLLYSYRLVGLNDSWSDLNNKTSVNYEDLKNGKYTFQVISIDKDENRSSTKEISFTVNVPPFYKTNRFYAIATSLLFILTFLIFRQRLKTIKRRAQEQAERERMEQELRTAHETQMKLMPDSSPEVQGFDIFGLCFPAHEVGGDFYNYFWLDEEKTRLGIVVADVSGKAMKAAMAAVLASGMLSSEITIGGSPKDILNRLNKTFHKNISTKMFITFCFMELNLKSKTLTLSNAGQSDPLLIRNGEIIPMKMKGKKLPLGILEDICYEETIYKLEAGDILIAHSDGINEAMNKERKLYGIKRLQNAMLNFNSNGKNYNSKDFLEFILNDVRKFIGDARQSDDITMVAIKVN